MPAYIIVRVDIHDPQNYDRYKALAPASIKGYGGRYLTRAGAVEVLEGEFDPKRLVILEFPDMARAKAWHDSPEYAPARALRTACARSVMLLAEGVSAPVV
jgi:uncharacterized protein (DUF1330 family)